MNPINRSHNLDRLDPNNPARLNSDPYTPADATGKGTVLVNGKPLEPAVDTRNPAIDDARNPNRDEARASGATREAAASKVAEQKMAGHAQEARLRSIRIQDEHASNILETEQSPTVLINDYNATRKDRYDQCGDAREAHDREINRLLYSENKK